MNNAETMKLIDGHFAGEDASEILMNLFSSRIDFYNVKNFSSYVRFGCDDEIAQERIASLSEEMRKLQWLLAEAKAQNKKLVISSEINIVLEEE